MKEGKSPTIEYIWIDGVARYAQFLKTDYSSVGPIIKTVDPNWYVWHRDDNINKGEFEWLNYLDNIGRMFRAKIHCRLRTPVLGKGVIDCWFEHKQIPGGHDEDSEMIRFLSWDKTPWQATLNPVGGNFPAQPTFTLKRI